MTLQTATAVAESSQLEDGLIAVHGVDLPRHDKNADASSAMSRPSRSLDIVGDVKITLDIRLGSTVMSIAELMSLAPGSVVELDRCLGESVDVLLNDRVIGNAEIVAVGEYFGVRLTELAHATAGGR